MITKTTGYLLGAAVAVACISWAGPMADATTQSQFGASAPSRAITASAAQGLQPYVAMGQTFMWPGR